MYASQCQLKTSVVWRHNPEHASAVHLCCTKCLHIHTGPHSKMPGRRTANWLEIELAARARTMAAPMKVAKTRRATWEHVMYLLLLMGRSHRQASYNDHISMYY